MYSINIIHQYLAVSAAGVHTSQEYQLDSLKNKLKSFEV